MSFDFRAWYSDAHKLLSLSKQAGGWFLRCNRNTISASDDPTPEAKRERFDNLEIELKAEVQVILLESDVIRHGQAILERDFHLLWPLLEPAYFDLRDIEAEGLGSFCCAWWALNKLADKTQQWAVDVWAVAHREKRGLNCSEWCDWMDKAGWLSNTVDALHARLTLEKSWLLKHHHPPLVISDSNATPTEEATATKTPKRRSPKELDQAFFDAIKKLHNFDPTTMTCSHLAPITNQALADEMGIAPGKSTADRLEKFFDGKYDMFCSDSPVLAAKLATLGDTGINANLANALAETKAELSKTKAKVLKKIADCTLDEDFLE